MTLASRRIYLSASRVSTRPQVASWRPPLGRPVRGVSEAFLKFRPLGRTQGIVKIAQPENVGGTQRIKHTIERYMNALVVVVVVVNVCALGISFDHSPEHLGWLLGASGESHGDVHGHPVLRTCPISATWGVGLCQEWRLLGQQWTEFGPVSAT